jgi:hypothetical protein
VANAATCSDVRLKPLRLSGNQPCGKNGSCTGFVLAGLNRKAAQGTTSAAFRQCRTNSLSRASWYGHLRHLTPKRGKGASGTQGHDFFDLAGGFAGGLGGASTSSSVKASSDAKGESATNPSLEFSRAPVLSFARGEELVRAVASYDRV